MTPTSDCEHVIATLLTTTSTHAHHVKQLSSALTCIISHIIDFPFVHNIMMFFSRAVVLRSGLVALITVMLLVNSSIVHGFTVTTTSSPSTTVGHCPTRRTIIVTRMVDDRSSSLYPTVQRGVSVDQDGKSNVWAIEPKVEISTKSAEEQTSALLIAGGALGVVAAVAAFALTNLPDPSQY
jgi:hypothetical protein